MNRSAFPSSSSVAAAAANNAGSNSRILYSPSIAITRGRRSTALFLPAGAGGEGMPVMNPFVRGGGGAGGGGGSRSSSMMMATPTRSGASKGARRDVTTPPPSSRATAAAMASSGSGVGTKRGFNSTLPNHEEGLVMTPTGKATATNRNPALDASAHHTNTSTTTPATKDANSSSSDVAALRSKREAVITDDIVSHSTFTRRQLKEIEDVFSLFNFHTHQGLMRGDDLAIALRVLGLDISRDQHKGYVALYSTSAINTANKQAREEQEGGTQSSTFGNNGSNNGANSNIAAILNKMATTKASQNYFTLADFVEVCEDAKAARLCKRTTTATTAGGLGFSRFSSRSGGNNKPFSSMIGPNATRKGPLSVRTADMFAAGGGNSSALTGKDEGEHNGDDDDDGGGARGGGGGGGGGSSYASRSAAILAEAAAAHELEKAHTQQWLEETFDSFGEISISAGSLQKSLEKLFASIKKSARDEAARAAAANNDGGDDYDEGALAKSKSVAVGTPSSLRQNKTKSYFDSGAGGDGAGANRGSTAAKSSAAKGSSSASSDEILNGILDMEIPTVDEIAAAFAELGVDPDLGLGSEDLGRLLGTSATIL